MPFKEITERTTPRWLFNSKLQTIVPSMIRKVLPLPYERETFETSDDDFLYLDWSRVGSRQLVIVFHGLTGGSHRPYVMGMVRAMNHSGWDALAWNCRSATGELNRNLIAFHSGFTQDMKEAIQQILDSNKYDEIVLLGFSMGGNMCLKYAGEMGESIDSRIVGTIAFSVPLHLASGAARIDEPRNKIYQERFLKRLKRFMERKAERFPNDIDLEKLAEVKTLREFDDHFTAPIHGFKDAAEFYEDSASLYYLDKIARPSLIVNAANDPFLSEKSLPRQLASKLDMVNLEITADGGHVGFTRKMDDSLIWSELRAVRFVGRCFSK